MKFKKRILTEEVGLPRSHRKTYTTNKKQKVVVSESQLQRLIGIITEQNVNTPGAPNPKDYKKGGQDPKYLADKKSFLKKYKAKKGKGTKPTTGGPTPPPAPNFNMSTWSPGFKKKVDTFLKNKNIKGAERFLKGRVDGWKKKSMKAGPKWKKQLKAKTDFAMKLMKDVKKAATKKPLKEQTLAPTSPKRKMCCRDRNGVITSSVNGRCPKSSTKVPCKGTPPTNSAGLTERDGEGMNKQKGKFDTPKNMKACKAAGGSESLCAKHLGAGTMPPKPTSLGRKKWLLGGLLCCAMDMPCCGGSPIDDVMGTFEENRTLKTTNPINESDIKDMKNWFNRVNKSGRGYNPSKI
jgi:hypothetical protein